MRRTKADPGQFTMDGYFAVPRPPEPRAGSFQYDPELRNALSDAIKHSGKSRAEIAAIMTDLVFGDAGDGEVTKHMIDSWTAPSRDAWAFPVKFLPAFVRAAGAIQLLDLIAEKCGCRVLVGEEALLAEWGALSMVEKRIKQRRTAIERRVPDDVLANLENKLGGKR